MISLKCEVKSPVKYQQKAGADNWLQFYQQQQQDVYLRFINNENGEDREGDGSGPSLDAAEGHLWEL